LERFIETKYKERGARYTLLMLSKEQKKIGVIAASAGQLLKIFL